MPTINLSIVSTVTYTRSAGAIIGRDPQTQILRDLNGVVYEKAPVVVRELAVSPNSLPPYEFEYKTTGTNIIPLITLSNYGNSPLTVYEVQFTADGVSPVLGAAGEILANRIPITINSGSSYSFRLGYYGEKPGIFNNSFTIRSNDNVGAEFLTVPTFQTVTREYDFYIEPGQMNREIVNYGKTATQRFEIYPIDPEDTIVGFDVIFQSSTPGFTVEKISNRTFDIHFDANKVNNINGTYTNVASVLTTVQIPSLSTVRTRSRFVNAATTVNIDQNQYQNYNSWLSAGSHNNSIIGISYDKINGLKYITIGIGAGADNSPEYYQGGSQLLALVSLGTNYLDGEIEFPYWSQVYRIPVEDNVVSRRNSQGYAVKTFDIDYGSYFGEFALQGSMFIIENDGFNNFKITLNKLRELSDNENINYTLKNLSRAFYYYSVIDVGGGRITQLGSPKGDGFQTDLFTGFNSQGSVTTELVYYPLND